MSVEALCLEVNFKPAENSFGLRVFSAESPQVSVKAKSIGDHVVFESSPEVIASGQVIESALSLNALLELSKKEASSDSRIGKMENIGPILPIVSH